MALSLTMNCVMARNMMMKRYCNDNFVVCVTKPSYFSIMHQFSLLQATVSDPYCQNVTANEEEKHEKEISNLIAGLTYEFKVSECLFKMRFFSRYINH